MNSGFSWNTIVKPAMENTFSMKRSLQGQPKTNVLTNTSAIEPSKRCKLDNRRHFRNSNQRIHFESISIVLDTTKPSYTKKLPVTKPRYTGATFKLQRIQNITITANTIGADLCSSAITSNLDEVVNNNSVSNYESVSNVDICKNSSSSSSSSNAVNLASPNYLLDDVFSCDSEHQVLEESAYNLISAMHSFENISLTDVDLDVSNVENSPKNKSAVISCDNETAKVNFNDRGGDTSLEDSDSEIGITNQLIRHDSTDSDLSNRTTFSGISSIPTADEYTETFERFLSNCVEHNSTFCNASYENNDFVDNVVRSDDAEAPTLSILLECFSEMANENRVSAKSFVNNIALSPIEVVEQNIPNGDKLLDVTGSYAFGLTENLANISRRKEKVSCNNVVVNEIHQGALLNVDESQPVNSSFTQISNVEFDSFRDNLETKVSIVQKNLPKIDSFISENKLLGLTEFSKNEQKFQELNDLHDVHTSNACNEHALHDSSLVISLPELGCESKVPSDRCELHAQSLARIVDSGISTLHTVPNKHNTDGVVGLVDQIPLDLLKGPHQGSSLTNIHFEASPVSRKSSDNLMNLNEQKAVFYFYGNSCKESTNESNTSFDCTKPLIKQQQQHHACLNAFTDILLSKTCNTSPENDATAVTGTVSSINNKLNKKNDHVSDLTSFEYAVESSSTKAGSEHTLYSKMGYVSDAKLSEGSATQMENIYSAETTDNRSNINSSSRTGELLLSKNITEYTCNKDNNKSSDIFIVYDDCKNKLQTHSSDFNDIVLPNQHHQTSYILPGRELTTITDNSNFNIENSVVSNITTLESLITKTGSERTPRIKMSYLSDALLSDSSATRHQTENIFSSGTTNNLGVINNCTNAINSHCTEKLPLAKNITEYTLNNDNNQLSGTFIVYDHCKNELETCLSDFNDIVLHKPHDQTSDIYSGSESTTITENSNLNIKNNILSNLTSFEYSDESSITKTGSEHTVYNKMDYVSDAKLSVCSATQRRSENVFSAETTNNLGVQNNCTNINSLSCTTESPLTKNISEYTLNNDNSQSSGSIVYNKCFSDFNDTVLVKSHDQKCDIFTGSNLDIITYNNHLNVENNVISNSTTLESLAVKNIYEHTLGNKAGYLGDTKLSDSSVTHIQAMQILTAKYTTENENLNAANNLNVDNNFTLSATVKPLIVKSSSENILNNDKNNVCNSSVFKTEFHAISEGSNNNLQIFDNFKVNNKTSLDENKSDTLNNAVNNLIPNTCSNAKSHQSFFTATTVNAEPIVLPENTKAALSQSSNKENNNKRRPIKRLAPQSPKKSIDSKKFKFSVDKPVVGYEFSRSKQPGYNFANYKDSQEIADNNDPKWAMYNLKTPQDCFQAVCNQWSFDKMPNPHIDLTRRYHNKPAINKQYRIPRIQPDINCLKVYNQQLHQVRSEMWQHKFNLEKYISCRNKLSIVNTQRKIQELQVVERKLQCALEEAVHFYKPFFNRETGWDAKYVSFDEIQQADNTRKILQGNLLFYGR